MKLATMTVMHHIMEAARLTALGGGSLSKTNQSMFFLGCGEAGFPEKASLTQEEEQIRVVFYIEGRPLKAYIDFYMNLLEIDIGFAFNAEHLRKTLHSEESIEIAEKVFAAQSKKFTDLIMSWLPKDDADYYGASEMSEDEAADNDDLN